MNNLKNYHAITKEDVMKEFSSNINGISEAEANLRLEQYGKNIIDDSSEINLLKIFLQQFNSILVYVLIASCIISVAIAHYIDAGIIFAIVFIDGIIGFIQQYKAEKAINELKKIFVHYSRVLRNGKMRKIKSDELVPGDILVLSGGDKINADCRIASCDSLEVNEAVLTGESFPVEKEEIKLKEDTVLAERKNMLYSGTSIVKGNCKCLVVSTGMNTEFGKIASLIKKLEPEETLMQRKLNKFATHITILTLALSFLIVLFGLYFGMDKYEILLTAVALAISAIPEGLPAVITIGLAIGAGKMAKSNVIIRRLAAAESLGSVTIICSDKTGTITEEKMKVKKIFADNKILEKRDDFLFFKNNKVNLDDEKEMHDLIKTSVLCNNARFEVKEKLDGKITEKYDIIGDPTESALVLSALDLGMNKKILTEEEPRIKEFSFSAQRKIMSIIRGNERSKKIYSKGASNVILDLCSFELLNGEIKKLTSERKKELLKISEKIESEALRVLGFAFRNINKNEKNPETGLIFLGFIGMQDIPRKEVKSAIESCKKAGIKIKMITGDSVATAREIAKQVGIDGKIVSGAELEKMPDEALIRDIENISIFARTSPEQKLRIVEILKLNGENVAITGDGVNDTLALKKADIGIAMGIKGTDAAREVSDMILADDNFASIVKAIEEGRIIYDNTKKITKFLIAVNFSELLLIAVAILMQLPLPLLPIQILWMNLITDSIPALALIKEKGEDVMSYPPKKEDSVLNGMIKFIIIAGIIMFAAELAIFLFTLKDNFVVEEIRSIVLTFSILFQLFFVYTCRSNKSLLKIGIFSNKYLNYAVFASIAIHLFVVYSPLNVLFEIAPLKIIDWGIIIPSAMTGVVLFEAWKIMKREKKA
jgi:Ca2+-transporting ATPase